MSHNQNQVYSANKVNHITYQAIIAFMRKGKHVDKY